MFWASQGSEISRKAQRPKPPCAFTAGTQSVLAVEAYLAGNIGSLAFARFGAEVIFAGDCVGEKAFALSSQLKPGQVLLLENLRFHKEEEKGDADAVVRVLTDQYSPSNLLNSRGR